jgi:hypothetical protein
MSRSRCRLPVARPSVTSRASSEVDFRSVPVNAKNTANLIRRCADRQGSTWEDRAPMRFREGQRAVAAPADGHDSGHGSWTTPARRSGRGMGRVLAAIVGERPNVNGVRFIVPELAESQRRLLDSLVRSSSGKPDSGTSMMAGELMTPPEQERRPQVAGPSCRSRGGSPGVIALAIGSAIPSGSVAIAAATLALIAWLEIKARWEERRLVDTYPAYAAYAARTPRFIPSPRRRPS